MSALVNGTPTMSSMELVELINGMRTPGKVELRHDNFMSKIEKHPGIMSPKFLGHIEVPGPNGGTRKSKCYFLPKRECELMVMSESLEVQTKVYDRLSEIERPTLDRALQALKLAPLAVKAARAFGLDKNVAAISANQYVCSVTGHNLLKEFGSTHLLAENQETQWFTPTQLKGESKVSAQKLNEALATAGLQERRDKVWELTPAGHAYARLFDTGKKHNSGTMVQQIRWSPKVLAELRQTGTLL